MTLFIDLVLKLRTRKLNVGSIATQNWVFLISWFECDWHGHSSTSRLTNLTGNHRAATTVIIGFWVVSVVGRAIGPRSGSLGALGRAQLLADIGSNGSFVRDAEYDGPVGKLFSADSEVGKLFLSGVGRRVRVCWWVSYGGCWPAGGMALYRYKSQWVIWNTAASIGRNFCRGIKTTG